MKRLLLRFSTLALIITVILTAVIALPVWAVGGLSVEGALLDINLSPGQNYTHTITVNSGADYPMDMQVEARGFGQTLDGATIALLPQDDNSPHSARTFINGIDTTSFQLEPGNSHQINATINVPSGTSPGTRYAIIYVYSQPGGSSRVGVVVAANVLVVLHISDPQPVIQGKITNLDIPEIEPGKPIQILTTFQNTGNIHFKAMNQVTVTDEDGLIISQTEVPLISSSIIPTFSVKS